VIYTFAAGNERALNDDVNGEGWLNSMYTITVGAIAKDHQLASYSSTGGLTHATVMCNGSMAAVCISCVTAL
jgi:isoaspartyl peptidase/L-asparaginase-like protein (Ntn-hydrolase superfamily)